MNHEGVFEVDLYNDFNLDCENINNLELFNSYKKNLDFNKLYFSLKDDSLYEVFTNVKFILLDDAYYSPNTGLYIKKIHQDLLL